MEETALKAFYEVYGAYQYPFSSADKILASKDDGYRAMYYEGAKKLVEDEVLNQELTELKRNLYAKLALQSMTDVERTAYRTTLIALVDFEKRLQSLAAMVKQIPLKRAVDML